MSKKRRSSADSSTNAGKSPVEILVAKYGLAGTIIAGLLTLVGVVIASYFTYLATRPAVAAPSETALLPTNTSVTALTVQPTSVTIVAATESPALIPTAEAITSEPVTCITALRGTGAPAEVQTDSLIYVPVIGSPGTKLILANGVEFLFSSMKSFEVVEVTDNPYRVKVSIILLNGESIADYIGSDQAYWEHLEGITKYGSFSMQLSKVKRVEFRDQGGCQ